MTFKFRVEFFAFDRKLQKSQKLTPRKKTKFTA